MPSHICQYTKQCFMGRDNTRADRFRYIREFWHGGSGITVPVPGPEDCIGRDNTRADRFRYIHEYWK